MRYILSPFAFVFSILLMVAVPLVYLFTYAVPGGFERYRTFVLKFEDFCTREGTL